MTTSSVFLARIRFRMYSAKYKKSLIVLDVDNDTEDSGLTKDYLKKLVRRRGFKDSEALPDGLENEVCMIVSNHSSAMTLEKSDYAWNPESRVALHKKFCRLPLIQRMAVERKIPIVHSASFEQLTKKDSPKKRQKFRAPKAPQKSRRRTENLRAPFIKVEDIEQKSRPRCHEIPREPVFWLHTGQSRSAFHPPLKRPSSFSPKSALADGDDGAGRSEFCEICTMQVQMKEHVSSSHHKNAVGAPKFFEELDQELLFGRLRLDSFIERRRRDLLKRLKTKFLEPKKVSIARHLFELKQRQAEAPTVVSDRPSIQSTENVLL